MDIYRLFEHRIFVHHLPIVLNWIWKNIVTPSYRFRIIEILLYIFFATTSILSNDTIMEEVMRMTMIGSVMVTFNLTYLDNEYSMDKILFNNSRTCVIACVIGVLLTAPFLLLVSTVALTIFLVIFIIWKITTFKK